MVGTIDDIKRAYIAGYIDGDGSINATMLKSGSHSGEIRTELNITSVNPKAIKEMQSWFGTGYFEVKPATKSRKGYRTAYVWRINTHIDMLNIINEVIDFMITRKEQALIMREYIMSRMSKPRELVDYHKNGRLYRVPQKPGYSNEEIQMIMNISNLNKGVY